MQKLFLIMSLVLISIIFLTISVHASSEADGSSYTKSYTNLQVHAGDTLTSMIEEYALNLPAGHSQKDYYEEVLTMNHIENPDKIQSGDYIIVPYYTFASAN